MTDEYPLYVTVEISRPLPLLGDPVARYQWLRQTLDQATLKTFGEEASRYLDAALPRILATFEQFQPSRLLFAEDRAYLVAPGKYAFTQPRTFVRIRDSGFRVTPQDGWAGFPTADVTAAVADLPIGRREFGKLATASHWYVASLGEQDDPLRAFLFAFFGLEVLANKVSNAVAARVIEDLATDLGGLPLGQLVWPSNTKDSEAPWRNLTFRFACTAIWLSRVTAAADVETLVRFAAVRNSLAHGGASTGLDELPADECRQLLQRYLLLAASAESDDRL